ncbi:MAG: GGDEF domain-containing protein [Anaerolineaceae bacterium]
MSRLVFPTKVTQEQFRKKINFIVQWLTKPKASLKWHSEYERRRANLLTWILLVLFVLVFATLILVLIVNPLNSSRNIGYVLLIFGLLLLVGITYGLNRNGHYYLAAGLIIICAVIGPWGSLFFDPNILQGDIIPLTFVLISVILSSILLSPLHTIVLAALQWIALLLLPLLSLDTEKINWPSFLAFVFFTSLLSVVSSTIYKNDLALIDRQAIELSKSAEKLREESIRDYLTGLFNRRYLEETLDREINRAARKLLPVGIIMIDIDHFKDLNDSLGHDGGDAFLAEMGKLLKKSLRFSDIACRFGGEEFVLVLPEASQTIVKKRAEYLAQEVKKICIDPSCKTPVLITISQGVAAYPINGVTGKEILKAADNALYQAKREGRDRVVVAK